MKRALLTALLLCAFTLATAQDKPKPETVRLDSQSQQELAEAQRQASETKAALDTASARYEAAQQKVITAIFKAMADAGLKPKEWTIKQDQAGIYFERVPQSEMASKVSAKPQLSSKP